MTRETKAGLVVSCSFLCLVGAVVTVKLRQKPDEVAQVDPGSGTPAAETGGQSALSIPSKKEKEIGGSLTSAGTPPAPTPSNNLTPLKDDGKHHDGGIKPAGANELEPNPVVAPPAAAPVPPPLPATDKVPMPGTEPLPPAPGGVGLPPEPPVPPSASGGDLNAGGRGLPPLAEKKDEHEEKKPEDKNHADDKKKEGSKEKNKLPPNSWGPAAPPPAAGPESLPSPLPPAPQSPVTPGPAVPLPSPLEDKTLPPPSVPPPPAPPGAKPDMKFDQTKDTPPAAKPIAPPPPAAPGSLEPKPLDPPPPAGLAPLPAAGPAPKPLDPLPAGGTFKPGAEPPAPVPAPLPAPVSPAAGPGVPLPTLGGGLPPEDKPLRANQPPAGGKPEGPAPAPIPAPIPAPAPTGSAPSGSLHSDFIPKAPPAGADAAPVPVPVPVGDAGRPGVTLQPIRPMPPGSFSDAEAGTRTSPIVPAGTPAPVPVPAPPPPAPVGAAVTVTAPPISLLPEPLPARSLAPNDTTRTTQVVSYEEVRHIVRAGDTFQSLSKEYYNNEGYAPALKLWNQNHPRATDAMAHDGTPVPGERVFIPPMAQLEQHYGSTIPSVKSAAKPTGTMQTSYTAPATAPELAYYRVIRDESVEAIAGATLGSRERATDVQRLNPLLARTGQIVPAGTLLALPAAARVPQENVPH